MPSVRNPRAAAALIICQVVFRGRQLSRVLERSRDQWKPEDRGLVAELSYGVVRWYWLLEHELNQLLDRPMRSRDQDVLCLLCAGLYQLRFMAVPQYACVSETVKAADSLGKSWARGLVNAVLRKFQRFGQRRESSALSDACRHSHPQWMIDLIRQDWPNCWQEILNANNARPKMTLRVDVGRTSVAGYLDQLKHAGIRATVSPGSPCALQLDERVGVERLPGFAQGVVSVQSAASQMAALSMELASGHRVLDACSAPGGKLLHILEVEPRLDEVLAIDIDQARTLEIVDNLTRAGKRAQVIAADAARPDDWWDGKPFDRILVDAPCSAFGVISKHPDIKHHRRPEDITRAAEQQRRLLEALLPLLNDNGKLLYTTCSILAQENDRQIENILHRHPDLVRDQLSAALGAATRFGRQRLQGSAGGDGFYYARLSRS